MLKAILLDPLDRDGAILPLMARFVFAATLAVYFWTSGLTKLGDGVTGLFAPSMSAYAQIFPRAMEAVSYDVSQFGAFHWAVVTAGTVAEFVLPALLIIGLATRPAALGMIGFVLVQTLTDLRGHGALAHPETVGAWFDRHADAPIMDQRALWLLLLAVPVLQGPGALSVDRLIARHRAPRALPDRA